MATRKRQTPKGRGGSSGGANPRNDGRITEEQHDDAMRVLRAEYYQSVRGMTEDLKRAIKDGEVTDQESLETWIQQSVDGSYWVIYTHANFQVLMCSNNYDAYSEDFGEPPLSGSDINWAALAYAAMQRDLQQQIDAEGITVEHEEDLEEARHRPQRRVREPERDRWIETRLPKTFVRQEDNGIFVSTYGGHDPGSYGPDDPGMSGPDDAEVLAAASRALGIPLKWAPLSEWDATNETMDGEVIRRAEPERRRGSSRAAHEDRRVREPERDRWIETRLPKTFARQEDNGIFVSTYGGHDPGSYGPDDPGMSGPDDAEVLAAASRALGIPLKWAPLSEWDATNETMDGEVIRRAEPERRRGSSRAARRPT